MLLVFVGLQSTIQNFSYFLKSESNIDIVDDSPEQFAPIPLEEQRNFVMKEFNKLLVEI